MELRYERWHMTEIPYIFQRMAFEEYQNISGHNDESYLSLFDTATALFPEINIQTLADI